MQFINGMLSSLWDQLSPENRDFYLKSGAGSLYELSPSMAGVMQTGSGDINESMNRVRMPPPPNLQEAAMGIVAGPYQTSQQAMTGLTNQYNNAVNYSNTISGGNIPTMTTPVFNQPQQSVQQAGNNLGSIFNTNNGQQQQSNVPQLSSMFEDDEDRLRTNGWNWGNYQGGRY